VTLTKISLANPVAVVVACLLLCIFGILSLARLPIQMTPEISRPEITVRTSWRASAPNEIESEIIEPQEDVLRSIPGLLQMQSSANYGSGYINLQFEIVPT
jgi:multidrug efflux pump subunit AcrB